MVQQIFNEQEWLKHLLALNDTYTWLERCSRELLWQLPVNEKRKFREQNYYLSLPALAHILKGHFVDNNKVPLKSKFTCTLVELLLHIRDAWSIEAIQVPDSTKTYRIVELKSPIGIRNNVPVSKFTILTDAAGKILTAFPGFFGYNELMAQREKK